MRRQENPEASLPGFWVDSVLPASAGRTKLELPARCWQHVYRPFGNALVPGVNSVFAGQLLNAENRGGPQSVATGHSRHSSDSCGCRNNIRPWPAKIFVYKRTGR